MEMIIKDVQVQSVKERCEYIIMGEKLNDGDINHAQKILKAQFSKLNGLRLRTRRFSKPQTNWCKLFIAFRGITGSLQQPLVVIMVCVNNYMIPFFGMLMSPQKEYYTMFFLIVQE